MEFITKPKSRLDALMYWESASSERISLFNIAREIVVGKQLFA